MKKIPLFFFTFMICFLGLVPRLKAQPQTKMSPAVSAATTVQSTPAVSPANTTDAATSESTNSTSVADENKGNDEESDAADKPFVPHWTGQLGFNYSNQPSQLGQGQITRDLSFTGTYDIAESGHYFSVGLTGGQQKVEGADSNYGSLTLEGGLGLGIFLPSLSVGIQEGASALNSFNSTLTLNFQIFEPLTVGLTLGGSAGSHQGPVSQLLGANDSVVEIDDVNWSGGLVITFIPWDFLSLSLTGQQEYDTTYQYQNILHTSKTSLNQSDRIPSITLGSDITFWKYFALELSLQAGQEYFPAGTIYSPVLGRTVNFTAPNTQSFSGFTVGLMYSFK